MNKQYLVGALVVVLAVAYLARMGKKEGFRVSSDVYQTHEHPLPLDRSPPISEISESQFRGGYADLVDSPKEEVKAPEALGQYYSPQEMLPSGTLDASSAFREDGSIPNDGVINTINLSRSKYHSDCITATFSLNLGEGIVPVNSVHKDFTNAYHYKQNSLITGTDFDTRTKNQITQDAYNGLELRNV